MIVEFEGQQHQFPDDFSQADIAAALGSVKPPSPNPLVAAVKGVPGEIARTAGENWQAVKDGFPASNPEDLGATFRFLNTGKSLAAIPALLASPISGAAKSLIGQPMAAAERAIGSLINPEAAKNRTQEQAYEDWRPAVDTAMSAIAPRGFSPAGVRTTMPPVPAAAELTRNAVNTFEDPAIRSIQIPPQDVTNLTAQIHNDLTQQGYRPTRGNAESTLTEINRMTPGPNVAAVTVDDLRAARRSLGITAEERNGIGRPTPDASAATKAIHQIDTFLDGIAPELRNANANYSAGMSANTLDYRQIKAEHRAAKSGTGGNIENTMRQEVDKIPNRGLRPEEIALRDQIVEGTPTRNALRLAGKLGVDGGLSLMLHAGAAAGTGGTSLPVTAAGTLARLLGQHFTRNQIAQLSEMIRSRAPLSQARVPIAAQQPDALAGVLGSLLASTAPRSLFPFLATQEARPVR
jgi:hypothetical protein